MDNHRPAPLQNLVAHDCNRMAWRGQTGHYEVWFLTLTHKESQTGFWIRYTLESPEPGHGQPYAELWFCRSSAKAPESNFGIHRRFDIAKLHSQHRPFVVRIGDADLGHGHASGALLGDGHTVRWDLHWEGCTTVHRLLPDLIYQNPLGLAETVLLSPNHSIFLSGTIEVDGQRYEVTQAPGGQSHLWGKKHAYGWAWARCNAFSEEGAGKNALSPAVFEALTVKMRRGPLVIPLTVVSVYPDGLLGDERAWKEWAYMPFSKAEYRTGTYVLSCAGPRHGVDVRLSCTTEDMLRTEYVDPDGSPAFNHFAGTASCELVLKERLCPGSPWRPVRTFHCDQAAQFEWAGRAGDSQVRKRHILLSD
ncbi:MAG TPA: hypothetical protein PKE31_20370 [Pseudomonadota bacterium]|nr:hypothetical protein [Pseudomonadota bacterium]